MKFIYTRACGRFVFAGLVCVIVCGGFASAKTPSSPKASKSAPVVREPNFDSAKSSERLEALETDKNKARKISPERIKSKLKGEKDPLVRHRLNQALAASGTDDVLQTLVDSLQNDPDPMVRQGAAQSLSQYSKNPFAAQSLAESLATEKVPSVRYACALSLSLSESAAAFAALQKAASDSDINVRKQIAYGLHRNSHKNAQKILKKLQGDKDPSVREVARKKEL